MKTRSAGSKSAPKKPTRPLPADVRWWAIAAVSGLVAYVAASHVLFFYYGIWQIPLFVGCVVGLTSATWAQAAIVAPLVAALPMAIAPPTLPFSASTGPLDLLIAVVLSAGAAALIAWGRERVGEPSRERFVLAAAALLVVWTIANLWAPLLVTGLPVGGYGSLAKADVSAEPRAGAYATDEAVFRRMFYLMHDGESSYKAMFDAWMGQGNGPNPPNSVVAYRLPTLFWVWSLTPRDAFSIVYVFLVLASVGIAAAASIAGQLAGPRFAPLGAVAVAAYILAIANTGYVTYVDLPAASIALVGFALFAWSARSERRAFVWAAVVTLLAAALMREILAYMLALGALSALLLPKGTRLRGVVPWLAALGVFTLAYAAHVIAAAPFVSAGSGEFSWLSGSPGYALAGLTGFAQGFSGQDVALFALFLIGLVGAYAANRKLGWQFSAFALAACIFLPLVMVRFGNPTLDVTGGRVNYWGIMFVPLALSMWPAWVVLPGILQEDTAR